MESLINAVTHLGLPTVLCGALLWGIVRALRVAHKDVVVPIVASHKTFIAGTQKHLDSTSQAIVNIGATLEKLEAALGTLLESNAEMASVMRLIQAMPKKVVEEMKIHVNDLSVSSTQSDVRPCHHRNQTESPHQ